jgi:hypothetical protein
MSRGKAALVIAAIIAQAILATALAAWFYPKGQPQIDRACATGYVEWYTAEKKICIHGYEP